MVNARACAVALGEWTPQSVKFARSTVREERNDDYYFFYGTLVRRGMRGDFGEALRFTACCGKMAGGRRWPQEAVAL